MRRFYWSRSVANLKNWCRFEHNKCYYNKANFCSVLTGIVLGFSTGTIFTYFLIHSTNYSSVSQNVGNTMNTNHFINGLNNHIDQASEKLATNDPADQIVLVNVVCNDFYVPTYLTFAKSALIFQNSSKLHFVIITEDGLRKTLDEQFKIWRSTTKNSFTYEIQISSHPTGGSDIFPKLIRPLKCGLEKLFLPDTLKNFNKVLYIDSDMLFLNDLSDIWNQFKLMNSTQICGVRPNYIGDEKGGLNGGILLMNLKKMRQFNWSGKISKIIEESKSRNTGGDQEIINIFFRNHPETLFLLPGRFGYNPADCNDLKNFCLDCVYHGFSMLHGFTNAFQLKEAANKFERPFHFIYRMFSQYEVGNDPYETVFKRLMKDFENLSRSTCTSVMDILFRNTKVLALAKEMNKKH